MFPQGDSSIHFALLCYYITKPLKVEVVSGQLHTIRLFWHYAVLFGKKIPEGPQLLLQCVLVDLFKIAVAKRLVNLEGGYAFRVGERRFFSFRGEKGLGIVRNFEISVKVSPKSSL